MDNEPTHQCPECSDALELWDYTSSGFLSGLGADVLACVGFGALGLVWYAFGIIAASVVTAATGFVTFLIIQGARSPKRGRGDIQMRLVRQEACRARDETVRMV